MASTESLNSAATTMAKGETIRGGGTVKMTTRYTDEEWAKFIAEVGNDIVVQEEACAIPDIGGPALAEMIDHTLLKLDVRVVQFHDLCAEARVNGFAVGMLLLLWKERRLTNMTDCVCASATCASVCIGFEGQQRQGRECNRLP